MSPFRNTVLLLSTLACLQACSGGGGDDGESNDPVAADGGAVATQPDGGSEGPATRAGLAGFCDYYKECGGGYYATAQDCIDASIGYWGECRQAALDTFGDCMMGIDCADWNPDTYNPANTECSEEWSGVQQTSCD